MSTFDKHTKSKTLKHPAIHIHESFNQNMVRLVLYYNILASKYLLKQSNVHENIHQARLCFKRIRSYLRLGRTGMGEQQYMHYNTFYRDLARSLSQLRDVTALTETLPQFIKTRRTEASRAFLTAFKSQLLKQREQQLEQITGSMIMTDVIKALRKKSEEIEKWNFEANTPGAFITGATRIYRRGRKLFMLAQSNPDGHNLHEWRKQVKYFWYHLLVISPIWPGIMATWAKEVQTLSQMLGKHHDLVMLENALDSLYSEPRYNNIMRNLRQSISIRKHTLEQRCFALGLKLYFETPDDVRTRLAAYWQ